MGKRAGGTMPLALFLSGIVLVAAATAWWFVDQRRGLARELAGADGAAISSGAFVAEPAPTALPERRQRLIGPYEAVVLLVSALWVMWDVLSSPVKGLANQGDYQRLTVQLGVAPVRSQPYSPYALTYLYKLHQSLVQMGVAKSVASSPKLYSYYYGYHSSTLLMAKAAIGLHYLLGGGNTFDIRWLGFLNALVWLAALASLLVAMRQLVPRARGAAVVLVALALTDFGYVEYFNSFFSEPAEMGFLLLALGLGACMVLVRRPWLAYGGFVLAACMAVSAKTEDAVLAIPVVALGVVLAWRHLGRLRARLAGIAACGFIAAAGLWSWTDQVPYLGKYQLYDSVFDGILRSTPRPRQALTELGLRVSLVKYAGYATADHRSAFAKPFIQSEFFDHISTAKIIKWYLHHPANLLSILKVAASRALYLRPPYGNLPASSSSPTKLYDKGSIWTTLHRSLFPHSLWFIVGVLVAGLVTGLVLWCRQPRSTSPEVLVAACLIAGIAFLQVPVGGGLDGVIKHNITFNALFDLVFIVLVCLFGTYAWRIWTARTRLQLPSVAADGPTVTIVSGEVLVDGKAQGGQESSDEAPSDDVDDDMSPVGS